MAKRELWVLEALVNGDWVPHRTSLIEPGDRDTAWLRTRRYVPADTQAEAIALELERMADALLLDAINCDVLQGDYRRGLVAAWQSAADKLQDRAEELRGKR